MTTSGMDSPAAFNIAASRAQVVNFLKTSGAQNPALSREVLLEYGKSFSLTLDPAMEISD